MTTKHSFPPRRMRVSAPRPANQHRQLFECEADVLEGLEDIACAELLDRLGSSITLRSTPREGTIRFLCADLRALLGLRSIIAVYLVRVFPIPRPRALLGHEHLTNLCDLVAAARTLFPAGADRTLYLSAAGSDTGVMNRLKAELAQYTGLEVAADEGDVLVRLRRSIAGPGWEALVRISPRPLATRAWRVCNLPGALNATLAHAMMRISEPRPDDLIVNLACGSGTLLVERLALGPAKSALGCDLDLAALECAHKNLGAAGFAGLARLERWDATALSLPDRSATMICSDLPFGQLVGSHRENENLYPRIIAEATRIAVPGARMVLLTHEVRLLERAALEYARAWRMETRLAVRAGGMTPRVFLFRRL